jgi:F420-dependent oxidoreductase-like protein
MRIGLTGGGATPDKIIEQARRAEADGFTSLWYASVVQGDPLVAMALAGRATTRIELGTAVVQTYPCHPLLQAQRAASVAASMGRPGFTLGVGPSHRSSISDVYGLSYDHPGRNTEEYVKILTALLRGLGVDVKGVDWSTHAPAGTVAVTDPVPVLLAALSPRLLQVAGEHADGVILWSAPPAAIEHHIVPRVAAAARDAGRPTPRIVAGLPVAVHDDISEARAAVAMTASLYGNQPNYQRVLRLGGAETPAEIAIVGHETSVRRQLQGVLDTGATDLWLNIVPVGNDPRASIRRTKQLLVEVLDTPPPGHRDGTTAADAP